PERPDYLDHELATGTLVVATSRGDVVGFAGVLERGEVAYLADLFVRRDLVGKGVGRALLDAAFGAGNAPVRAVCAAGDPRAAGAAVVRVTPVTGSTHAREAFVAPSFAASEGAARGVLVGAVWEGATRADAVHAAVPGPHPALAPLLASGFRIVDRDTVMASR